jgi:hypothetical protein
VFKKIPSNTISKYQKNISIEIKFQKNTYNTNIISKKLKKTQKGFG